MLSFASDYTEGACEEILQKLAETNRESLPGYGMDRYCQSAARKIQEATGCPEAEVYFLVGGTQTNAVVISSILAPYEGVVAAQTGHVSIHEAGAIEYTGHKVLQLPEKDGKIDPADLQEYLQNFEADANNDHMVFPGMVYLSHPTEYGTLYSRKELQAISEICRSYEIPLYLDGARLGYGLAGEEKLQEDPPEDGVQTFRHSGEMKGGGVRIDLIEERTEFFRAGDRPDPRGEAHAIAFEDHSAFRGIVEESNHPIPCGTEAVDEIRSFQHHMGKGSDPLFSINAVDGIFALGGRPDSRPGA